MTAGTNKIDDPRLRFYLERRSQIDEWAGLKDLEIATAGLFLRTVASDAERLARELGSDVIGANLTVEGEELVALSRSTWPQTSVAPGVPMAMVAIGWWPRRVQFEGAESAPWVGLLVPRAETEALREILGHSVQSSGAGKSAFPKGNPQGKGRWLRFRWEPCRYDQYWDDLGPYRHTLTQSLEDAWNQFSPVVDETLKELAGH